MSTQTVDPKMAKLPVWARHELQQLRANLAAREADVAQINGTADTNCWRQEGMDKRPLPKDSCILFRLHDGKEIAVFVREEGLEVYGNGSLAITPRSSNVVFVQSDR